MARCDALVAEVNRLDNSESRYFSIFPIWNIEKKVMAHPDTLL